jgi:hypothetical protein
MSTRYNFFGGLVTDGMILNLDAAKLQSYSGSGTNWVNLINNSISGGTLTNGPTLTGSGKNLAITFDGTNDYTEVLDNSIIDFGTSNFTSNIWIYPNSSLTSNTEFGVINKNNGFQNSTGWGLELSTYDNSAPFNTVTVISFNSAQSSWGQSTVGSRIRTNTWSNVNLVRIGNKFEQYVNGSLSGTKINSNVGLNVDNSVNLTLGKSSTWQSYFKGNISNFNLFNRALSPFDIFQNFNAYKSRYGIPDIVTSGLTLNLDAGNPYSYSPLNTGSTTWVDTTYTTTGGTLINGTSYSDGTMVFDGTNDYAKVSDINITSEISIEGWVYANSVGSFNAIASQFQADTLTESSWVLETVGSDIRLYITNNSSLSFASTSFSTLVWTHIVGTFNGTTIKIYKNSVLGDVTGTIAGLNNSNLNINIGALYSQNGNEGGTGLWNGKISNVKIYNRALSQDEITQNFNATRGRYGI